MELDLMLQIITGFKSPVPNLAFAFACSLLDPYIIMLYLL